MELLIRFSKDSMFASVRTATKARSTTISILFLMCTAACPIKLHAGSPMETHPGMSDAIIELEVRPDRFRLQLGNCGKAGGLSQPCRTCCIT